MDPKQTFTELALALLINVIGLEQLNPVITGYKYEKVSHLPLCASLFWAFLLFFFSISSTHSHHQPFASAITRSLSVAREIGACTMPGSGVCSQCKLPNNLQISWNQYIAFQKTNEEGKWKCIRIPEINEQYIIKLLSLFAVTAFHCSRHCYQQLASHDVIGEAEFLYKTWTRIKADTGNHMDVCQPTNQNSFYKTSPNQRPDLIQVDRVATWWRKTELNWRKGATRAFTWTEGVRP